MECCIKIATWGIFGNNLRKARIPIKLAGLWSGANSLNSSISFSTSSVIATDSGNFSPPCTTRWPVPSISLISLIILCALKASNMISTASTWSLISCTVLTFSPLTSIVKLNPSIRFFLLNLLLLIPLQAF